MQKEDILILSIALPNRKTGGGVLDIETLEFLSKQYNIHLICVEGEAENKDKDISTVKKFTKTLEILPRKEKHTKILQRIKRLISTKPRFVNLIDTKKTIKSVEKTIEKNNIKKIFMLSCWPTVMLSNQIWNKVEIYTWLMNIEHKLFPNNTKNWKTNIYNTWETLRVKKWEKRVLSRIKNIATLTQKDSDFVKKFVNKKTVVIHPVMKPIETNRGGMRKHTALITTNMTYTPNHVSMNWFFDKVVPHLPGIEINITGLDQNNYLKNISDKNKNINYLGFVSTQEWNKLFSNTAIVINPTITGSGFQIKTMEAIRRGIPVISTSFSNQLGNVIPSSDNPKQFAELIKKYSNQNNSNNLDYSKFYKENGKKLLEFIRPLF